MTPGRRAWTTVLVAVLVVSAACTSTDDSTGPEPTASGPEAGSTGPEATGGSCDPIDPRHCLLPFPGPRLVVADETTETGVRVALPEDELPANVEGARIDPTDWNRADGFSPGTPILVHLPAADLDVSDAPTIGDIARSLEADSPIVVVDVATGEQHPVWAEQDAQATTEAGQLLIIRPAVALEEGHRYAVAIRRLVDGDGDPVEPSSAFAAYRDGEPTDDDDIEAWRPYWDDLFGILEGAGVERENLIAAWDFRVASTADRSGRLLSMRDQAFAELGDDAPAFEVSEVDGSTDEVRVVNGTFEVPRFLTGDGGPGSRLDLDEGDLPADDGFLTVDFVCTVPARAGDDDDVPADTLLYGHGLLGDRSEGEEVGALLGPLADTAVCATDWIGMSSEDVTHIAGVLGDLSDFGSVPDRLQQAHLNFLYLGRLATHEDGFASDEAFRDGDGRPVLSGDVAFLGNSQGGILGGATSAVAQDWERVILGVPGMNYSTLLRRSIDFDRFLPLLRDAYPDGAERTIALALVQQLWDRGENQGYAAHLTDDPYPDTPAKQVLLFEAFGDHQVANVATETLARTIDARIRVPAMADGRSNLAEPFWGLEPITAPADASAYLVVWDFGTPPPPLVNIPPRGGEDPHGKGSGVPAVLAMAAEFLASGTLVDVCAGGPCATLDG